MPVSEARSAAVTPMAVAFPAHAADGWSSAAHGSQRPNEPTLSQRCAEYPLPISNGGSGKRTLSPSGSPPPPAARLMHRPVTPSNASPLLRSPVLPPSGNGLRSRSGSLGAVGVGACLRRSGSCGPRGSGAWAVLDDGYYAESSMFDVIDSLEGKAPSTASTMPPMPSGQGVGWSPASVASSQRESDEVQLTQAAAFEELARLQRELKRLEVLTHGTPVVDRGHGCSTPKTRESKPSDALPAMSGTPVGCDRRPLADVTVSTPPRRSRDFDMGYLRGIASGVGQPLSEDRPSRPRRHAAAPVADDLDFCRPNALPDQFFGTNGASCACTSAMQEAPLHLGQSSAQRNDHQQPLEEIDDLVFLLRRAPQQAATDKPRRD